MLQFLLILFLNLLKSSNWFASDGFIYDIMQALKQGALFLAHPSHWRSEQNLFQWGNPKSCQVYVLHNCLSHLYAYSFFRTSYIANYFDLRSLNLWISHGILILSTVIHCANVDSSRSFCDGEDLWFVWMVVFQLSFQERLSQKSILWSMELTK